MTQSGRSLNPIQPGNAGLSVGDNIGKNIRC